MDNEKIILNPELNILETEMAKEKIRIKIKKETIPSFIKCKSCENMDELPNGYIDLIITSPPYFNAIDYDQHIKDNRQNYRPRQKQNYKEYLYWLEKCFRECYRVLKDGKFCCIVIGTVLWNGKHYPLPHHLISIMERIGYLFYQDIIWNKVTGGVKRAGVTIQNPYPGYYYPNIMTEYILIFQKPGDKTSFNNRPKDERKENIIPIDEIFTKEVANNIWHIAPVPPNQYNHPCPFPEEIPYRLIKLYSYKGDKILDPFLGIGTTTKVAKNLERFYYGYDIKKLYIDTAEKRLKEPLHLRKQLICNYSKIIDESVKKEKQFEIKEIKEKIDKRLSQKEFDTFVTEEIKDEDKCWA